jgi:hypothetical protein
MKNVILFALALAVCGVLHNSVLAQEDPRYVVTFIKSNNPNNAPIRSATVVTVVNQSKDHACNVQVEWFGDLSPSTPACTLTATLNPGIVRQFCSRFLPATITNCVSSEFICTQAGSLPQGKAIVSSTTGFDCSLIAVDARVYYTTPGDTAISAISNSKVVFFGEGNLGD